MKQLTVAVLGANGRSGRAFVDAALAHGFNVRAGVHHGSLPDHDNLRVLQVDATKPSEVTELLVGADAVVSLIGHVKGSPAQVQTEAIQCILLCAENEGVRRVISLTGTGVRFPDDKISIIDRILNISIKLIDPKRISDGIAHAKVLQQSQTDWSLLRVLKLSDGPVKPFILTAHGPSKLFSPRKEVAEAIVQLLNENSFVGQAPIMQKP